MPRERRRLIRLLAHLGFWLGALVIAGVSWTLYSATRAEGESARLVIHTQNVLQAIAEIEEAVSRADAAQRGYLITASKTFIDERDQAIAKVRERLDRIRALTTDNAQQQQRAAAIAGFVDERIRVMREFEGIRQREGIEGVVTRTPVVGAPGGSARMYEQTEAMRADELRLLQSREQEAAARRTRVLRVLGVTVLIIVMVLIPGYVGFAVQSRARRRSERNIHLIADEVPGALYQSRHPLSGEPELTFASERMNRLRGLAPGVTPTREQLIAQIHPDDRAAYDAAVHAAVNMMTPFSIDYRVRLPDDTLRWVHHEATPVRDDDNSVLLNGYLSDVTEQRDLKTALEQAREAADAANRAKSTFLATMSHEIRTPMNAVLGMLELLSLTRLDTEQRATLGIIQQSGRSLLRIIDDILDFSKIEAGRLDVRPEPTSIPDLVEDVYNIYSGNASSKGLQLLLDVDPGIGPALMVDSLRLRQILGNLVSNAIKFTGAGSVTIAARLVDRADDTERVRFSVTDTGPGIPDEDQQRLFQPFTQVAAPAMARSGGTGLGLAICRRLAAMMDGEVGIDSAVGRGTTMTLELTMQVANGSAIKQAPKEPRSSSVEAIAATGSVALQLRRAPPPVAEAVREGTLVLLVDDHPTNLMLLERQVQTCGYATDTAVNGREALDRWLSGRYGLVITDCNMPVMDGYELARNIRRIEGERRVGQVNGAARLQRTPIIACTANALAGEAEHCFAAGMDDYLVKPATLSQIVARLDRWLPLPGIDGSDDLTRAVSDEGIHIAGHPASTRSEGATPIDRSILAELTGANADVEQAVLANFRRVNEDDAAMLKGAIEAQSLAQVARSAHRIKGASRMVGAHALATVADAIEQASRADDWNTVRTNMSTFDAERARLDRWIDELPR